MKLRLFRGEHYIYVITQENIIQENPQEEAMLDQKIALKIQQDVVERLGNGNYVIEASFVSFSLELKYNGKVSRYHSDTINVLNKYYKSLNFLTHIKLNYEVSPEGVVSNLTGFEPVKQKIETDPQLSGLLRSFGTEQFLLEFYNHVPLESVGVGDKWTGSGILPDMMNLKYDIRFTFKEALTQQMKLTHEASFNYSPEVPMEDGTTGKLKETGTQKGVLLIDPRTRMCLSSDIDQQLEIILPGAVNAEGKKYKPHKNHYPHKKAFGEKIGNFTEGK